MSLDWEGLKGQVYTCAKCGAEVKGEQLIFINKIKCPECGCRVLKKQRPPIVKRMRAL